MSYSLHYDLLRDFGIVSGYQKRTYHFCRICGDLISDRVNTLDQLRLFKDRLCKKHSYLYDGKFNVRGFPIFTYKPPDEMLHENEIKLRNLKG